ncbi:MAG: hypothetical protein RBT11_13560 [Desulfobacterales bacterium]|jgi:membrane glycosyltransferase|nr:hypothetical protein [Desulfobacterales bacterium]
MAGFQELLIIVVICLGIFFVPRMLSKRPVVANVLQKRAMSGKLRIAVAVSVVHLFLLGVLLKPWRSDSMPFLYFGVAPVAVGWLAIWVYAGFKSR